MQPLIMGDSRAEGIREMHRQIAVWLDQEKNCPLCCEDADEDFPEEDLGPDDGCDLCEGLGKVTGHKIEEYAEETGDRSVLPVWYPRTMYKEGRL